MQKEMNIYINTRLLNTQSSGITIYIKELYSRIINFDLTNRYFFLQTNKGEVYFKNTVKIFSLPTLVGNFLFDFLYPLFIFDKKSESNIYHATTYVLPFYKPKNTKYILTIYDISFKVNKNVYPLIYQLYFDFMIKHSIGIADKIITISENTKKDLIKFYKAKPEKIQTIYISCSEDFAKYTSTAKLINESYIMALAGHPTRKNLKNLILSYKNSSIKDKIKLVIAGKIYDNPKKELLSFICRHGLERNIILTGFVSFEQLKNLYRNCLFFIYPSYYEGFGIPVLEAIKSNSLVVLSNTSSMVELLPSNYPLYTNPYDNSDITSKIELAYNLTPVEKKELLIKCSNFIKMFSWDICATKTLKLINNL